MIRKDHTLQPAKTLAILIGVSEFTDFQPIAPAINNVKALKEVLTDKEIFGIPESQVKTLINQTSEYIKREVIQLTEEARKTNMETLLLYFAGHGYRRSDRTYFLTGTNTEKMLVNEDGSTGINFDFLKNRIRKSRVPQTIMVLDACYSGLAVQGEDSVADLKVKGSYTLTSSDSQEVSYFDTAGSHTLFTGELLQILKNGVKNGQEKVSLDDLYNELARNTRKKNPKMSPQQMASNEIQSNRFFFFKNPAYDKWDELRKKIDGLIEQGRKAYDNYQFREARFSFLEAKDLAGDHPDKAEILKGLDPLIDSSREKEEFARKIREASQQKQTPIKPVVPPPPPKVQEEVPNNKPEVEIKQAEKLEKKPEVKQNPKSVEKQEAKRETPTQSRLETSTKVEKNPGTKKEATPPPPPNKPKDTTHKKEETKSTEPDIPTPPKKNKKKAIILGISIPAVIAIAVLFFTVILPNLNQDKFDPPEKVAKQFIEAQNNLDFETMRTLSDENQHDKIEEYEFTTNMFHSASALKKEYSQIKLKDFKTLRILGTGLGSTAEVSYIVEYDPATIPAGDPNSHLSQELSIWLSKTRKWMAGTQLVDHETTKFGNQNK